MCDFCCGEPGDNDKPYRYGNWTDIRSRLTVQEISVLVELRRHIRDVRNGYEAGPAYGDIAKDDVPSGA